MYREFFTEKGWAVTEARDGREALVLALKEEPSIVVTELWLPLIDGLALCTLLRRDLATSAVPILVLTSESRATYLKRAEHAGANAVLIKPSPPDFVVAEMDRLTGVASAVTTGVAGPARRRALVKTHERFETTTPNDPAPALICPICVAPLVYNRTFFGGVSRRHPERWDYFNCDRCGEFSYRHRTRKLRHIARPS
jgi:two-component system, chemotaxis family, chemotaxis protein CheY